MFSIFAEQYGYECDDNYHYSIVEINEKGEVLKEISLPECVELIYGLVEDNAIIKWHLEGQKEIKFKANDKGRLRTNHAVFNPYGVELKIGNCSRFIEKGREGIETLIDEVKDIESILEYDEELRRA